MQQLIDLGFGSDAPLSILALVVNLGVGIVLAAILRWHFERFGSTLSNRSEFAQVFPFIVLTTVLIITIVKSSLALSLGLVGALSIVRFRTPIKEPEELAYLFMAIAMGLGLGAEQTIPTVVASLLILAVVALFRWRSAGTEQKNLFLSVTCPDDGRDGHFLEQLTEAVRRYAAVSDLRRVDARDGGWEATFLIDVDDSSRLVSLMEELRSRFPGIGFTFIDQNRLPSV